MAEPRSLTGPTSGGTGDPRSGSAAAPRRVLASGGPGPQPEGGRCRFPLGCFTCVTGVSGSGKSTLVNETLYRALARHLHRARLSRGARRASRAWSWWTRSSRWTSPPSAGPPAPTPPPTPASSPPSGSSSPPPGVPDAAGVPAGAFSFNVKGGGARPAGDGLVKIEMHFLPDVYVPCDVCRGRRYNRETLDVHYKEEHRRRPGHDGGRGPGVLRCRSPHPAKLQTLSDVGLGYIHLGQSATTLSGGEAQRVKLATELARSGPRGTLYILDEPTTGLHFEDVRVLLEVLHRLVDRGNTVVVIEHNLDVIKTADWIIDLGPEGGSGGGRSWPRGPRRRWRV
jgi:excinuclease ABC subunit A